VTPAGDREGETGVNLGADIIALDREMGQRGGDIEDGERVGRRSDRGAG
jgi:hypothetical protein